MRLLNFVFALCASALLSNAAQADDFTVHVVGGSPLAARVDFPPGEGPFPAIVLAPGQGYHMNLPALEATARALAAQGMAVFRFNWRYFTAVPKGRPSEDLSSELKDLQAVVAAARQHPKVLAKNLSVGGKSLGSVVAWRAFTADASLRSALLLTPVCSRVPKGATVPASEAQENYPAFEKEPRPTLAILGDKDPLCATPVLYRFAASGTAAPRLAVVGGDHSYENQALPPAEADAARARNIAAVSAIAASFVAEAASAAASAP